MVVFFLGNLIGAGQFIENNFTLSRQGIFNFKFWQLVTYAFVYTDQLTFWRIIGFFFKVLILFMCLNGIQEKWGLTHTVIFVAVPVILKALAALWLNVNLASNSDFYILILFAFGFLYPEQKLYLFFFIPIPVKYLALFLFAGNLFVKLFMSLHMGLIKVGLLKLLMMDLSGVIKLKAVVFFLAPYLVFIYYLKKIFEIQSYKAIFKTRKKQFKEKVGSEVIDNLIYKRNKALYSEAQKALEEHDKAKIQQLIQRIEQKNYDTDSICEPDEFITDIDYCWECDIFPACLHRYLKSKIKDL
jgi:hypothetical protein